MDTGRDNFEQLRGDIQCLRRHNRWLAAFIALIGLCLVLSLALPVSTARARRFQLADDGNRQRGMWREQDGQVALILQDSAGRWRGVFAVDAEGPRLDLNSSLGRPLISLRTPQSQPLLTLHDVEGRPRVRITVGSDGPHLDFLDEEGRATASYPPADR